MYKKFKGLLNLSILDALESLAKIEPEVAESLQLLLTDQRPCAGEIELTCSRDVENLGAVDTCELIDDGRNVSLTPKNVDKYVEAYVTWTLVTSVKPLFDSLKMDSKMCVIFRSTKTYRLMNSTYSLVESTL
jgi:hypothetical protein